MNKKIIYYLLSIFLLVYFIIFLIKGNYEFLIYVFVTSFVLFLVIWADKYFNFNKITICAFGFWVILHMVGGSLYFKGIKFYNLILLPIIGEPYNILRYDQFLHLYCYVVVAMIVYVIAKKYMEINWYVLILIILAAEGIGAINEIIEFAAVVIAKSTGVGDYTNNALDLVFNLFGAALGTLLAWKFDNKKSNKEN
jgi:uncharacterized membrane protein YjdF